MDKRLKTEYTQHRSRKEAPDYMVPFMDILDLDNMKFIPVDEGLNAAIQKYFEEGDAYSGQTKESRNALKESYEQVYPQYDFSVPEERIENEAKKLLDTMQKQENKAALIEERFPITYHEKEKQKFIDEYTKETQVENLNLQAQLAIAETLSVNVMPETQTQIHNAIEEQQKEANTVNAMNDALAFMQSVDFEYLSRGAKLMCTGGGVCRHINLPKDHGLFYGSEEDPVLNSADCLVGDSNHITNFGTCSASNHPNEKVVLDDMVPTDRTGRNTQSKKEDTINRGFRCIPEIVQPGWFHTYDQLEVGETDKFAVSTKSFLVCIHGGMIYPLDSGQHSALQMQLSNETIKKEFTELYADYQHLKEQEEELHNQLTDAVQSPDHYSYAAEGGEKYTSDMILSKLQRNKKQQRIYRNEMGFCLDRAREDSYRGKYSDISSERTALLEEMLCNYESISKTDHASLKSDYYAYRRKNGYNYQSDYRNPNPGFLIGSDEYTDWRVGRMEGKNVKEAGKEYNNWKEDVNARGYSNLSSFEQEEFDRAGKPFGN